MALTTGISPARRGPPRGGEFGYPVAVGEVVYKGGLIGINASNACQRVQTSGTVAFLGVADRTLDNTAGGTVSDIKVTAMRGYFQLVVSGGTAAHIGGTVYATDDNTLTITNPGTVANVVVGTLAGIENSQTWVSVGSGG